MLKGSQALMAAIESGSPVPTNERQAAELAKHTPGPWHVLDGAVLCEGINAYGNWHICRFDRCEQPNTAEDNANARLIAAAPELLEACQAAVFGANHIDCVRAMQEVLPRIRAAIAKAGGAK